VLLRLRQKYANVDFEKRSELLHVHLMSLWYTCCQAVKDECRQLHPHRSVSQIDLSKRNGTLLSQL
jgi:hypothetical protein